jgi:ferritin
LVISFACASYEFPSHGPFSGHGQNPGLYGLEWRRENGYVERPADRTLTKGVLDMLTKVMQDGINEQINNELYSAYYYLAMAAYCQSEQFTGCAKWLRLQSQEENTHAMKLYDFLLARDGKVELQAIEKPPLDYKTVGDVFRLALEHEQQVTKKIDALYELAFNEKAFAALVELEWFITEQVEEEKTAREIVHKFDLVKSDPASLIDLDRDLGGRASAGA